MFAKPFVICKEPYSKIFHICFNYLNILCVYYIYKFKPVAFSDGKNDQISNGNCWSIENTTIIRKYVQFQ